MWREDRDGERARCNSRCYYVGSDIAQVQACLLVLDARSCHDLAQKRGHRFGDVYARPGLDSTRQGGPLTRRVAWFLPIPCPGSGCGRVKVDLCGGGGMMAPKTAVLELVVCLHKYLCTWKTGRYEAGKNPRMGMDRCRGGPAGFRALGKRTRDGRLGWFGPDLPAPASLPAPTSLMGTGVGEEREAERGEASLASGGLVHGGEGAAAELQQPSSRR